MNVKFGNTPFNKYSNNVKINGSNYKNFEKFGNGAIRNDPRSAKNKRVNENE